MKAMRLTLLTGLVLVGLSCLAAVLSPVAGALRTGEPLAGVLLGTDKVDYAQHSDTLMVWNYDPRRSRLDVLSIPRDTKIALPGYRFHRINEVFAYHARETRSVPLAAHQVMEAVVFLLSFDDVSFAPRYFLHLDYDVFRKIIDLVGGINVHVDEPMHYDDKAGNLHIHYDPGDYHLDGQQSLEYVRFRGKSGDRGRILRQMEFVKRFLRKLSSPAIFWRAPKLVATLAAHLHTNLRFWDLPFLLMEAKHLRPERFNPSILPGTTKGVYWEKDPERTRLVVRQIVGRQAPLVTSEVKAEEGATTVKVWNASKTPGLALKVTRRLRAEGFDVLGWGNFGQRQTKTRVVDRSGDPEKAQRVARVLGAESVYSDVNPHLRVDVDVVIGDDCLEKMGGAR